MEYEYFHSDTFDYNAGIEYHGIILNSELWDINFVYFDCDNIHNNPMKT